MVPPPGFAVAARSFSRASRARATCENKLTAGWTFLATQIGRGLWECGVQWITDRHGFGVAVAVRSVASQNEAEPAPFTAIATKVGDRCF